MTHLGLPIIRSGSNSDLLAYCGAGVFRKTSISKRTDTINNPGHRQFLAQGFKTLSEKRAIFLVISDSYLCFASEVSQRKPL